MILSSKDCQCRSTSQCKRCDNYPGTSARPWFFCCCTWSRRVAPFFRRTCACLLAAGTLTSCGTIPPTHADGRDITTQHGTARFTDALAGARDYCAKLGLKVRHLGTDTPYRSISRFQCIE